MLIFCAREFGIDDVIISPRGMTGHQAAKFEIVMARQTM